MIDMTIENTNGRLLQGIYVVDKMFLNKEIRKIKHDNLFDLKRKMINTPHSFYLALRKEDILPFWKFIIHPLPEHIKENIYSNITDNGLLILLNDAYVIYNVSERLKTMGDQEPEIFFRNLKHDSKNTYTEGYLRNIIECIRRVKSLFGFCEYRCKAIVIACLNDDKSFWTQYRENALTYL